MAENAPVEVTKLETIKSAIKKLASDASEEDVILYVDHDITMVLSSPEEILDVFQSIGSRILASADTTACLYDTVYQTYNETKRYPNFAGFIGYAKDLASTLLKSTSAISVSDLLTQAYGDEIERERLGLGLDVESKIFHTVNSNSAKVDLKLTLSKDGVYLFPTLTTKPPSSRPVHVLQTNLCKSGNSYTYLNGLASYLTPTLPEDKLSLPEDDDDELPTIGMSIFIERPTPFMEEFFINIEDLDYPKDKIHLFIHNQFKYNTKHVEKFLEKNGRLYLSMKYIKPKERLKEWAARKLAVSWAIEKGCDYWFSLDSTAHLDEETTLRNLIETNKLIVSPMLCTNTDYLPNICNWWGSLSPDGFYEKSSDYDDIAEDRHKGVWNVPYVSAAYLIKSSILQNTATRPKFVLGMSEPDLAFAEHNRNRGIFMHVTNEIHSGHLVTNEHFETGHLHDELYQIFDNRFDWENRYIHPNYSLSLKPDFQPQEPCRDVFWFPIVTPRFAKEMIEEMENYGLWADGSVEARGDLYPTVDIQMHEIGFHKHFHEFLRAYISPLQEKVFPDYEVYPPKSDQAFVVRYTAEDQRELKPHFDESTYTLNIALNTPHKDFEGGGCRFNRFNCSVTDTRLGWGFVHPGQFTVSRNSNRTFLTFKVTPSNFLLAQA